MEKVFSVIQADELYQTTGIQFLQFNTIFQLYALHLAGSPLLEKAATVLLMPDLLNYFLTGMKKTEITNAGTTQLLDVHTVKWSGGLIQGLGLPGRLFTDIIPSGTNLGAIRKDLVKGSGAGECSVIAAAGHDTQSAISAVPAENDDFIYISSGTWSCMGVELDSALVTPACRENGFANEQMTGGKIAFLKNIMGLWLVQECKREWDMQGAQNHYDQLMEMAARAKPFFAFVNPDHTSFLSPGDMPGKIREYCRETGQNIPVSKAQIIRCILEGLAFKYRFVADQLESLLNKKLPVIHIVGGGIHNTLLCRFTANATRKRIIAGPAEAAAAGNLMIQGISLRIIRDIPYGRAIIRNSFGTVQYLPQENAVWEKAYAQCKETILL
jgi:sugar (pentulose or hexulose) kinase